MLALFKILAFASFFMVIICIIMNKRFPVNIYSFPEYKSKAKNYRFEYNHLAITLFKGLLEMTVISGFINVISDEQHGSILLLFLVPYILLWIGLCMYDFLVTKTNEIETNDPDSNDGEGGKTQNKKGSVNVFISIANKLHSYGCIIRLSFMASGLILGSKYYLEYHSSSYGFQNLQFCHNMYWPGGFLLMIGIFAWKILSDQKENRYLFDILRLIVLIWGIPILWEIYDNRPTIEISIVAIILLPIDFFLFIRLIKHLFLWFKKRKSSTK